MKDLRLYPLRLQDPLITVSIGDHYTQILLDTGAEVSVFKTPVGLVTNKKNSRGNAV